MWCTSRRGWRGGNRPLNAQRSLYATEDALAQSDRTMATNLVAILGWGEYFPWAVPGLYAQGKTSLPPISFWIVFLTGLAGMIGTYLWWMYADQSR